jgi:DNA-directed RNA polymerase specialized sigma24 family protein
MTGLHLQVVTPEGGERAGRPSQWRRGGPNGWRIGVSRADRRRDYGPGGWPPEEELRLWPLTEAVAQLADPAVDVAAQALEAIEVIRVRRFVRQLPPLELVVISLRFGLIGGLPPLTRAEIGERIERPAGSVWWIENKALSMLRAMYDDLSSAA